MLYILILLTVLVLAIAAILYIQHAEIGGLKFRLSQTMNDMAALHSVCAAQNSCSPKAEKPASSSPFLDSLNLFPGCGLRMPGDDDDEKCSYDGDDYSSHDSVEMPPLVAETAPEPEPEPAVAKAARGKKIPNESAKDYDDGYEHVSSNDGAKYTVYTAKNGVKRWRLVA